MLIQYLDPSSPTMRLETLLLVTIIIALSNRALAIEISMFDGADCGGNNKGTATGLTTGECLTLGLQSIKSVSYTDVPNQIQLFVSGGDHDACSNGPQMTFGGGSGCASAPDR
jgi:hypothetical protein